MQEEINEIQTDLREVGLGTETASIFKTDNISPSDNLQANGQDAIEIQQKLQMYHGSFHPTPTAQTPRLGSLDDKSDVVQETGLSAFLTPQALPESSDMKVPLKQNKIDIDSPKVIEYEMDDSLNQQ